MSFIGKVNKGVIYSPGYFLAYNDEGVTRETRQFAQASALVITDENGKKHIPMGTAYPTNDGNAIGIAYEDVDVTVGDMPGSVVTGGATVYEDMLAVTSTEDVYTEVTPVGTENPKELGWYEKASGVYTLTEDTTVDNSATYYVKSEADVRLAPAAKTALEALGFKFIESAPAVTRPNWEV